MAGSPRRLHVRGLSLDLDGTLLDGSGFRDSAAHVCDTIARRLPGLDAQELHKANEVVWESLWAEAEAEWVLGRWAPGGLSLEGWRRSLRELGVVDEAEAREAAAIHHELTLAAYRLFADVESFLVAARTAGLRMVVTTNGASDTQREKLAVTGLDTLVDAAVVSGEVGVAKPDPAIFAAALSVLGVGAAECCHVGDSLEGDVRGALAAGMTAVWIDRDGRGTRAGEPAPDLQIASFGELTDALGLSSTG